MPISDTNIIDWKDDFGSGDTNTPTDTTQIYSEADATNDVSSSGEIVTPKNLGGQFRNLKSVIKGDLSDKAVEKWMFTNPVYLGRDTTDTYLEKIRVDGVFTGSSIFSPGTRVFFSTTPVDNLTDTDFRDNYREYGAIVVKIDTDISANTTTIYCQMGSRLVDTYLSATRDNDETSTANGLKYVAPTVESSYTAQNTNLGSGIYWKSESNYDQLYIPEKGATLLGEDIDDVFAVGDTVTIYKATQSDGIGWPLSGVVDMRPTWETSTKTALSSDTDNDLPSDGTTDTYTCMSWKVMSTGTTESPTWDEPKWKVTMAKSLADPPFNGTNTGDLSSMGEYTILKKIDDEEVAWLGPDSDSTADQKGANQFWTTNIDPVFVTRHFPLSTEHDAGAFRMYVGSVKADRTGATDYRRLADIGTTVLGDGTSTRFKVFFYPLSSTSPTNLQKIAPGFGVWAGFPDAAGVSSERRYTPYITKVQVTDYVEDPATPAGGPKESDWRANMAYRPRVSGVTRVPGTGLAALIPINQNKFFFYLEFEQPVPDGQRIEFDYTVEHMEHSRLVPNGDPTSYVRTSYPATVSVSDSGTDFTDQWDPDNFNGVIYSA